MSKFSYYLRRLSELYSFTFYKICTKSGFLFSFPRDISKLKMCPFQRWPSEMAAGNSSREYIVTTKQSAKVTTLKEDIFENNSSVYDNELHSFQWATYAAIAYDRKVRRILKNQISNWIKFNKRISETAWAPVIVAHRVYGWLSCYNNIIKTSESDFKETCIKSIMRQFEFLKKIRFLNYKITQIFPIYKTLIYCAFVTDDTKLLKKFVREFANYLSENFAKIGMVTPTKLVSLLKDLEEIVSLNELRKFEQYNTFSQTILYLKYAVNFIMNENGLAVFDSKYTPAIPFIKAILQNDDLTADVNFESSTYDKIKAFDSTIIVDKSNKFFDFEFNFANQSSNITNRTSFHVFNPENAFNSSKICGYELEQDHGFSLVRGNSAFHYLLGEIAFSRRTYMNNLGTEIRGEIIVASSFKMSVITEFVIYENVTIEPLVYQNGVNIIFKNGRKFLLNLSRNMEFSFCQAEPKIINGKVISPFILRLESFKNANADCVCKWLFKEI